MPTPLCASSSCSVLRRRYKNVRLHACRLAAATLEAVAFDKDAEISAVPWDALRLALLPRLRDKVSSVRAASAAAFRHPERGRAGGRCDARTPPHGAR